MTKAKRAKRDTYRYELKDGRNVVYRGITKDPDKRFDEHRQDKRFTDMWIVGPAVSEKTARKWERQSLQSYRRSHRGKFPKYNKIGGQ